MNNFEPQRLGMTAFMASNRVDFVLDGPGMESPERVSAFYDNPEAKLKLQGKQLKIEGFTSDSDGNPQKLEVKWGRQVIKLGRRKNASGPVSFYRSLETASDAAAPKSAQDIAAALSVFGK